MTDGLKTTRDEYVTDKEGNITTRMIEQEGEVPALPGVKVRVRTLSQHEMNPKDMLEIHRYLTQEANKLQAAKSTHLQNLRSLGDVPKHAKEAAYTKLVDKLESYRKDKDFGEYLQKKKYEAQTKAGLADVERQLEHFESQLKAVTIGMEKAGISLPEPSREEVVAGVKDRQRKKTEQSIKEAGG